MELKEPKIELIEINTDDIVCASNCPDLASQSRPSVQTCSTGAFEDQECADPAKVW